MVSVLFFLRHSIPFIELSVFLKLYTGQSVRNGTEADGKVDRQALSRLSYHISSVVAVFVSYREGIATINNVNGFF